MKNFKFGFTLAEVLITLAIIGVVAALTIPTLLNNYNQKVYITKLKKVYGVLNQAYGLATAEYGPVAEWGINRATSDAVENEDKEYRAENSIIMRNKLFHNLNSVQSCDNAKNQKSCGFGDVIYLLNGTRDTVVTGQTSKTSSLTTLDNASLMVLTVGGESRGTGSLTKVYALVYVDVNGINPPNTYGKDLFVFYVAKDRIVPAGSKEEVNAHPFRLCSNTGIGCAAWVIENENMDYLKCDDLSWEGKHRCSDK